MSVKRILAITSGFLLVSPSAALAGPNGSGYVFVNNPSLTLQATRVDIASPSSFNIKAGNFGLMRVAAEKDGAGDTSGIAQSGYGQFNATSGFDQGCIYSDPGQLLQYWELKPFDGLADQVCGIVADIGASEHKYAVERVGSPYTSTTWGAYIDGGRVQRMDTGFTDATSVYAGGEILDICNYNSNTAISGFYAYNGGQEWQRGVGTASSGVSWTTISSANGSRDLYGEWATPGPPGSFQISFVPPSSPPAGFCP